METQIKQILLSFMYDKLNLSEVENKLIEYQVMPKKIQNPKNIRLVSHYFFLKNELHLERLSKEEQDYLQNMVVSYATTGILSKEFNDFLLNNIYKLLLPDTDQKYLYWGPINNDYLAPADYIVLGLNYQQYAYDDNDPNEKIADQAALVCESANYIQEILGPKANLKVAVLLYNEIVPSIGKII